MKYITSWERMAREEGELKGELKTFLTLLQLKFGSIASEIEEKVKTADKSQLDMWIAKILTANSLESLFGNSLINSKG